MGRKKMDRANLGEQDSNSRNESVESVSGMENDRAERTMSAGSHGDAQAGDEGLDDPAISRAHRDDMSASGMHGDKLTDSQRAMSQRSRRTNQRANDERFDNADDFSGQGAQRGNDVEDAEGTGYTGPERANTDDSDSNNPLA
jgi:hypothetical protein